MQEIHKQKIRSLIPMVAQLIKASQIASAFETEKVIASTFTFSDSFKEQMRNVPPHYIERTQTAYSEAMFKAFESGYRQAKQKQDLIAGMTVEQLADYVRIKMPMLYTLSQDLKAAFEAKVSSFLETKPDGADMYKQFAKDLEKAYYEGVLEFQKTLPKPEPKPVVEMAPPAPAPEMAPPAAPAEPAQAATAATVTNDALLKKLEEYTKLLNDPQAEEVLRATLGLPPKLAKKVVQVKASAETTAQLIGPYDSEALRGKILGLVKTHAMDDNETQAVVIDCLAANIDDADKLEAASMIAKKLGLQGELSAEAVEVESDRLAAELTTAVGLPGELIFMNYENDYCLVFSFEKSNATELAKQSETLVFASAQELQLTMPQQGVLDVNDQKEIQCLAKLGKPSTLRDIKKASPKVADVISEVLTKIRHSKVGLAEGSKMLKANMEDFIVQAFGKDGLAYYKHLGA